MTTSMSLPPRDLTDAALARAVRAVLRLNGVPPDDVEDLLQDTRVEAQKAESRLPDIEPDRTNYVCGIARHLAWKWRTANAAREQREGAVPWAARPKTPPYEERDLAMKLHGIAVTKDPVATEWLVRAKVYGEAEAVIADEDGVPAERVRKRISRMVLFLRERALTLVAAIALLVAGAWEIARHRPEAPLPAPPVAEHVEPTPPVDTAATLRARARTECDRSLWAACLGDLDAARALDPAGETKETNDLRAWVHEMLDPPDGKHGKR